MSLIAVLMPFFRLVFLFIRRIYNGQHDNRAEAAASQLILWGKIMHYSQQIVPFQCLALQF